MERSEHRKLLDKYAYNNLSDAERKVIEKLRKNDPVFKEQLEFEERLKDSTIFDQINNLNNKASFREKRKVVRRNFLILLISIFTIVLLLFWYYMPNNSDSTEISTEPIATKFSPFDIYAKHLEHKPNFLQNKGTSFIELPDYQVFKEWMKVYEARNYTEAEKLFSQYKSLDNPYELYAQFYLGQIYLHLKKAEEAVNVFEKIIENSNLNMDADRSLQSYFESESFLGLGLAHILMGDLENVQRFLEKIQNDEFLGVKARTILQDIKQK